MNVSESVQKRKTISLDNEPLKLVSVLVFCGYQGISFFLTEILKSFSMVHAILVALCYIPFVIVLFREGIKRVQLGIFFFVALSFLLYSIPNSDFIFSSWAIPSSIKFFSGIMGFFILSAQDDAKKVTNLFKFIIVILFLYYLIYSFNIVDSSTYQWGYDMNLGYRMMLPCVGALYFAIEQKKKPLLARLFWVAIVVGALFVILSYGSRGPLLGVVALLTIHFLVFFFSTSQMSFRKKTVITFAVIVLIICFCLNFRNILLWFSDVLSTLGITSRTISRLIAGTVTFDNGRNSLWTEAINRFNLLGYGPFSDQAYWGEGNFCHNFFIEIYYDFGLIIGTGIILVLLFKCIYIFKGSSKNDWFGLFSIYLSYCLARLSFSGTFWNETNFWVLLGIGALCIENKQRRSID